VDIGTELEKVAGIWEKVPFLTFHFYVLQSKRKTEIVPDAEDVAFAIIFGSSFRVSCSS
jgi:hypothetical protein